MILSLRFGALVIRSRFQLSLLGLMQLLRLAEKEAKHLQAVKQRLFGTADRMEVDQLTALLKNPDGIDRLESFGAKFSRMQDTLIDKLLPSLLRAAGEHPGTAIDNLNRAERLGLLTSADQWLAMRRLRNRMVHEYIESESDMLPALTQAAAFTAELVRTYEHMLRYAQGHLGIEQS